MQDQTRQGGAPSPDESRERHRRGPVRLVGGVPYSDSRSTLSLLPGAPIGEWLHDHRHLVGGRLLDAGCGNRPYAVWYEPLVEQAVSLDAAVGDGVSVVGFADHLPFKDASFDTVLCTEVLEHVTDAERAAAEIRRVLKPGGHALVTVPFLYPVHEAPYDFRRLTHFGLRDLFERHGCEVVGLEARGGPLLLLLHSAVMALSMALDALGTRTVRRPLTDLVPVRRAIAAPQEALIRARRTNRAVRHGAFRASLGYMVVVRRPTDT